MRKAAEEARRNRAIERARPRWDELTAVERHVAAHLADVNGEQVGLIRELRDEGMTAKAIAAALNVDVTIVRRRMLQVVKVPSTKTQPLPESKR